MTAALHCSVNIPNFGDFADTHAVARVARAAEDAGWDALFVWDHVVHSKTARRGQPFGDPWMLLTAAALATSTLRLGPLVTPVARRRPENLARQVATLDALSGGRVIFGAGLGAPPDEFTSFGDDADLVTLAARLDEGLELLARYWSGKAVDHEGPHFTVRDVTLLPATVQQPRPPVWIAGYWPRKTPMRRAARWDGAVPLFLDARHGAPPPVSDVADLVAFCRAQRDGSPFDVVVGGRTEPGAAADVVGPLAAAGATWWDERQPLDGGELTSLAAVLRRIEAGPPQL